MRSKGYFSPSGSTRHVLYATTHNYPKNAKKDLFHAALVQGPRRRSQSTKSLTAYTSAIKHAASDEADHPGGRLAVRVRSYSEEC